MYLTFLLHIFSPTDRNSAFSTSISFPSFRACPDSSYIAHILWKQMDMRLAPLTTHDITETAELSYQGASLSFCHHIVRLVHLSRDTCQGLCWQLCCLSVLATRNSCMVAVFWTQKFYTCRGHSLSFSLRLLNYKLFNVCTRSYIVFLLVSMCQILLVIHRRKKKVTTGEAFKGGAKTFQSPPCGGL